MHFIDHFSLLNNVSLVNYNFPLAIAQALSFDFVQ